MPTSLDLVNSIREEHMKVTINIDCTPDEARTFFGLPDVKPMQKAMMDELENRMRANMDAMDPETLFKTWMPGGIPAGMQGWEQLQKSFWGQMNADTKPDDET